MFNTIMGFILTAIIGTRIAHIWQQRASKETRFFEASKTSYESMKKISDEIASLIGARLYASHRICRLSTSNKFFEEAKENFRQSVISWNLRSLYLELNIRTLYKGSSLVGFENLQQDLARNTGKIEQRLKNIGSDTSPSYEIIREIETIRFNYFNFLQNMLRESDGVFRQMHFGIKLIYNRNDIELYSTFDLLKCLFGGQSEESSVIRTSTDFGSPVFASDARLGID